MCVRVGVCVTCVCVCVGVCESPLDSKVFIEVLELVGIPHGAAVSFLREVLLTFLSSWRDRDAAFEAALPLFLSYEKASPASD